jgi:hypothetical protein
MENQFLLWMKKVRDEPLLPSNQGAKLGATWKFLKLWGNWVFFLDCPKPRGQKFMAAWFVDLKITFHNWKQDLELAFGFIQPL